MRQGRLCGTLYWDKRWLTCDVLDGATAVGVVRLRRKGELLTVCRRIADADWSDELEAKPVLRTYENSLQDNPSCVAAWRERTVCVSHLSRRTGRLYYEVELGFDFKRPRVGWLADMWAPPSRGDVPCVGDDELGWAADGARALRWHNGSEEQPWSRRWKPYDVVGCLADLDAGLLRFSLNGCLEACQMELPAGQGLFPAVSLAGTFELLILQEAWKHPPGDGYQAWAEEGVFTVPASGGCSGPLGATALWQSEQCCAWVNRRLEAAELRYTVLEKSYLALQKAERHGHAKRPSEAKMTELGWARVAPLIWPGASDEYALRRLPQHDTAAAFFASLVTSSVARHREHYHSTIFCDAPKLEVLHVDAVRNPRLLRAYFSRVEEMSSTRAKGCSEIVMLKHLHIPTERGSAGGTGPDLNEHFLLHGATEHACREICELGLDPRRGGESTGKMFGVGTYLAANSSKADIYTDQRALRGKVRTKCGAPRQIVVVRALLGESYRATAPMTGIFRPPDGKQDGRPLDSVWADTHENGGAVDHLEVMLYERSQMYPEAVVTYVHCKDCACAECNKRDASA